jgi:inner membrane transporter RhtA
MSLPILALLVAMTSIQCGASLAKGLFPVLGSAGTSAMRLGFAALILCLAFRPWNRKLTRREWRLISAYGLALGGMNLVFYFAIERIPLGIAVALEFLGPLSVSILSSRRATDFVWAALAGVGIFLILPVSGLSQPLDPLGIFFALFAGFCWAMYIIFGHRAGGAVPPGIVSSYGMLIAAALVFPAGATMAGAKLLNVAILPWVAAMALFSSVIPYSLEMYSLSKIPRKDFGILMSLEPALAALAGLLFLREGLSPTQWLAIGLVIVASAGTAATSEVRAAETV